jgi:uncharacterized protein YciI
MVTWYLALRRPLHPRATWNVTLDDHLAWMRRMHAEGSILFSGPNTERTLGIYIIRAGSREGAERIAASDPYTAGGCTTYDLHQWEVHQALGVGDFGPRA